MRKVCNDFARNDKIIRNRNVRTSLAIRKVFTDFSVIKRFVDWTAGFLETILNSRTFKVSQMKKKKKNSYVVHFDKREIQSVSGCAQRETLSLSLSLFPLFFIPSTDIDVFCFTDGVKHEFPSSRYTRRKTVWLLYFDVCTISKHSSFQTRQLTLVSIIVFRPAVTFFLSSVSTLAENARHV